MLGADVDEVDVQIVDFGDEIRYGVEPRLDLAPVVIGLPIAQNLLDGLERHALRMIRDRLTFRQARPRQALTEIGKGRLREVDMERTDRVPGGGCRDIGVMLIGEAMAFGRRHFASPRLDSGLDQ